ncbi:hypothetical protein GCM10027020_29600 [Nocardioides salsibiostraticola]
MQDLIEGRAAPSDRLRVSPGQDLPDWWSHRSGTRVFWTHYDAGSRAEVADVTRRVGPGPTGQEKLRTPSSMSLRRMVRTSVR